MKQKNRPSPHRRILPTALTVTAGLLAAGWTGSAVADGGADTVDEIIVTADKRARRLQDVPSAVTVVSGADIVNQRIHTVGDIYRQTPNLIANEVTGHEQPRWYIRGIGYQDPGNLIVSPVSVYFDDVYLNNPYSYGFPLFDLERIEVLRGPQGTLWGKNTTGGAVHILSAKPSFQPLNGYAQVGYASYNTRTAEGAIDSSLNETLAARLSFHSESSDRWLKTISTGQRVHPLQDDAIRLQLAGRFHDLNVLANAHYRRYEGNNQPFVIVRSLGNAADPLQGLDWNHVSNGAIANYDNITEYGGSLKFDYQYGRLNFVSVTGASAITRNSYGQTDVPLINPLQSNFSRGYLDQSQVTQEFRLSSPKEDRFNWITGAHFFHEDLTSRAYSTSFLNTGTSTLYRRTQIEQSTDSAAIFVSGNYSFTDRLNLTLGARHSVERKDVDLQILSNSGTPLFSNPLRWWDPASVSSPLVIAGAQDARHTWSRPTYDATLQYKFSDDAQAYARYSRGFRSGGFNGGATNQSQVAQIAPEFVNAAEIGVKTSWFNRRLTANASAFHYNYNGIQANVLVPIPVSAGGGFASQLKNAGSGRSQGLELEFTATPVDNLRLFANGGYLHTRYTSFNLGNGNDATGNAFANAPKFTLNAGIEYRIDVGPGALLPEANISYRSRTYFVSDVNQADPYQRQDGYAVGNLSLAFETNSTRPFRVTAYVHNVANKRYLLLGLPGNPSAYRQLAVGEPRVFGVSASQRF